MIKFTQGNLLEAQVEVLVNTVNTVGVVGKGIALMFKERFDENFRRYAAACKAGEVQVGHMFVTPVQELDGPRWIVNFPTKQHWRSASKMEWIVEGLQDLRRFIIEDQIRSIAIPPLGAGNGGLNWSDVRKQIELALGDLEIEILVFEPTSTYQNIAKRTGVETLTPARALVAELVRRYSIIGMECSILEIQKLAWFLEKSIERFNPDDTSLDFRFQAGKFGPYSQRLLHLLDKLDGSYLRSDKRIADSGPFDVIWFNDERKDFLSAYLKNHAKEYAQALEYTSEVIDGFQSPFGMELIATVDWLLSRQATEPSVPALREGLREWPASPVAAARKVHIFDDRELSIALRHLTKFDDATFGAELAH